MVGWERRDLGRLIRLFNNIVLALRRDFFLIVIVIPAATLDTFIQVKLKKILA
jgi:hypothetical protein